MTKSKAIVAAPLLLLSLTLSASVGAAAFVLLPCSHSGASPPLLFPQHRQTSSSSSSSFLLRKKKKKPRVARKASSGGRYVQDAIGNFVFVPNDQKSHVEEEEESSQKARVKEQQWNGQQQARETTLATLNSKPINDIHVRMASVTLAGETPRPPFTSQHQRTRVDDGASPAAAGGTTREEEEEDEEVALPVEPEKVALEEDEISQKTPEQADGTATSDELVAQQQSEKNAALKEIDSLKESKRALREELDKVTGELSTLKNAVEQLHEELETAKKKEKEAKHLSLNANASTTTTGLAELEASLHERTEERDGAQKKLDSVSQGLENEKKKALQLETNLSRVIEEKRQLEERIQEDAQKTNLDLITALEEQKDLLEAELMNVTERYEEQTAELVTAKEELAATQNKLIESETERSALVDEILVLKKSNDETRGELEDAATKTGTMKEQMERLQKDVEASISKEAELSKELDQVRELLTVAETKANELAASLRESTAERDETRAELESTRQLLEEEKQRTHSAEEGLAAELEEKRTNNEKASQLDELRKKLAETTNAFGLLEEKQKTQEEELAVSRSSESTAKARLKSVEAQMEEIARQNETLESKLAEATKELENSSNDELINTRLDEYKRKTDELKEELESKEAMLVRNLATAEEERNRLTSELSELRRSIQELTEAKEEADRKLQAEKESQAISTDNLVSELETMKQENAELKKLLASSDASVEEARDAARTAQAELNEKHQQLKEAQAQLSGLQGELRRDLEGSVTKKKGSVKGSVFQPAPLYTELVRKKTSRKRASRTKAELLAMYFLWLRDILDRYERVPALNESENAKVDDSDGLFPVNGGRVPRHKI